MFSSCSVTLLNLGLPHSSRWGFRAAGTHHKPAIAVLVHMQSDFWRVVKGTLSLLFCSFFCFFSVLTPLCALLLSARLEITPVLGSKVLWEANHERDHCTAPYAEHELMCNTQPPAETVFHSLRYWSANLALCSSSTPRSLLRPTLTGKIRIYIHNRLCL